MILPIPFEINNRFAACQRTYSSRKVFLYMRYLMIKRNCAKIDAHARRGAAAIDSERLLVFPQTHASDARMRQDLRS